MLPLDEQQILSLNLYKNLRNFLEAHPILWHLHLAMQPSIKIILLYPFDW